MFIEMRPRDSEIEVSVVESRLRYGTCEVGNWYAFSHGAGREAIWAQHRLMGSEVIRIHAFDRGIPDPIKEWPTFAAYIQAVLNSGATPMVTFARSKPPFDNSYNRRWFANRCGELVWHCIERWGADSVRRWYWSVWTKPNSQWDNPGMTFESYRAIYEDVAGQVVRAFGKGLEGSRPLIGGPAIDGFQPFWFDWIWRFVEEIDPALIGFVSWHRYGEWRSGGEWRSATDARAFRSLVMSRTSEYCTMGRQVQRVIRGRKILNVCAELNAHAHYDETISGEFNLGAFGAAYYAASLLQLIRGGTDLELRSAGSDAPGTAFGVMDSSGRPHRVFFAKALFASAVPRGSTLRIASARRAGPSIDAASVERPDGTEALILVHKQHTKTTIDLRELGLGSPRTGFLLKLDASADDCLVTAPIDDRIALDGYGIAVAIPDIPAVLRPHVLDVAEHVGT